ncbi:hypothetical protein P389DRAFT_91771 [Cystobasidium minutum MCA 4210]|uniref:uncharacterized protein n=1 Tax=Cystobasidium minutum MCA 4210 TaxID=1397322 RepID=UPI0034CE3E08|eukprot:jgi/Rhomi1/91771/CE91770_3565
MTMAIGSNLQAQKAAESAAIGGPTATADPLVQEEDLPRYQNQHQQQQQPQEDNSSSNSHPKYSNHTVVSPSSASSAGRTSASNGGPNRQHYGPKFHPAPRLSLDLSSLSQSPGTYWPLSKDVNSDSLNHARWQGSDGVVTSSTSGNNYSSDAGHTITQQYLAHGLHNQEAPSSQVAYCDPKQQSSSLSPYFQLQQSLKTFQQLHGMTSPPSNESSSYGSSHGNHASAVFSHGSSDTYVAYDNVSDMRRPTTSVSHASAASSASSSSSTFSRPQSAASAAYHASIHAPDTSSLRIDYSATAEPLNDDIPKSEWSPAIAGSDAPFAAHHGLQSHQSGHHHQQQIPQQQFLGSQHGYAHFQQFHQSQYSQGQDLQGFGQPARRRNSSATTPDFQSSSSDTNGHQSMSDASPYRLGSYWHSDIHMNGTNDISAIQPIPPTAGVEPSALSTSYASQAQIVSIHDRLKAPSHALSYATSNYRDSSSPQLASPDTSASGTYAFPWSSSSHISNIGTAHQTQPSGETGFHSAGSDNYNATSYFSSMYTSAAGSSSSDFSIQDLQLHFDYSKPGDPQPRPALQSLSSAPSKPSKGKRSAHHRQSGSSIGTGHATHLTKITATLKDQVGDFNMEHKISDEPVPASPCDSTDSAGSNFFSKGSKRSRPGRTASNVKSRDKQADEKSDTAGFSSGQGCTNAHSASRPLDMSASRNSSYQSNASNDAPSIVTQESREALLRIAALQLNHTQDIQQQTYEDPYTAGQQSSGTSSSSLNGADAPDLQFEADAVDGTELKDESQLFGSKAPAGGRRQYDCKICSRSLTVHERIHSGEKPFVCKFCNRPFTVASNLRRHQKIHSKQKEVPVESIIDGSHSSGSTVKGAPASKHRRTTSKDGQEGTSDYPDSHNGSTSSAADRGIAFSGDKTSGSNGTEWQGASASLNTFNLPQLYAEDLAKDNTKTAHAVSVTMAEQRRAKEKRDLDNIMQWSRDMS